MKHDNSQPFWKSIRGVGQPGTHRATWHDLTISAVPDKDYSLKEFKGQYRKMLVVQPPIHNRCGLPAEAHDKIPNEWFCPYCIEKVSAPMRPNAMVPEDAVKDGVFEPTISDKDLVFYCTTCNVNRSPRADNQGWRCACTEHYWPAGVHRVSPTNGF